MIHQWALVHNALIPILNKKHEYSTWDSHEAFTLISSKNSLTSIFNSQNEFGNLSLSQIHWYIFSSKASKFGCSKYMGKRKFSLVEPWVFWVWEERRWMICAKINYGICSWRIQKLRCTLFGNLPLCLLACFFFSSCMNSSKALRIHAASCVSYESSSHSCAWAIIYMLYWIKWIFLAFFILLRNME